MGMFRYEWNNQRVYFVLQTNFAMNAANRNVETLGKQTAFGIKPKICPPETNHWYLSSAISIFNLN